MREPQTRVIDGRRWDVTPLPTGQGLSVLTLLAKVLGPAVGTAKSLAELQSAAGAAVVEITDRLSETDLKRVCDLFAAQTRFELVPGSGNLVVLKGDHFETHFAGNYGEMLAWLRFAFEVNFGSFLAATPGATAARAGSAAKGA